ncbi:YegP family protein [Nocardia iowensis]
MTLSLVSAVVDHLPSKGQALSRSTRAEVTEMAAKFEMYKDKAGKYRFRLKATNGEIIAVGEAYESETACENGIESVKKNAPTAEIVNQIGAGV